MTTLRSDKLLELQQILADLKFHVEKAEERQKELDALFAEIKKDREAKKNPAVIKESVVKAPSPKIDSPPAVVKASPLRLAFWQTANKKKKFSYPAPKFSK